MNLGKVKEGGVIWESIKERRLLSPKKPLKLSQAPYLYPFYPVELYFVMIMIVRFI